MGVKGDQRYKGRDCADLGVRAGARQSRHVELATLLVLNVRTFKRSAHILSAALSSNRLSSRKTILSHGGRASVERSRDLPQNGEVTTPQADAGNKLIRACRPTSRSQTYFGASYVPRTFAHGSGQSYSSIKSSILISIFFVRSAIARVNNFSAPR